MFLLKHSLLWCVNNAEGICREKYRIYRYGINSFLKDYHGYVETDGFSRYNDLLKEIIRCTCWSHMRRRWVDALPKKECSDPNSVSAKALLMISEIYAEDNKHSKLSIDERTEKRQKIIKPFTDSFYSWLDTLAAGTDSLKKAINYALNQKNSLLRFLENGIIPLDNNRAERAIRQFAIGRINWLACENNESADVCMDMYSIVRTAMANGLNVFDYLVKLFSADPGELVMPVEKTKNQLCIVHQIRNSCKFVPYKDKKAVCADLKKIYGAVNLDDAEYAKEEFREKWDKNWSELTVFFEYPQEIRKIIYTTNAVESYHRMVRKITKSKAVFPTDDSIRKVIFMSVKEISKKWTMPVRDWGLAYSQLAIFFEDRFAA